MYTTYEHALMIDDSNMHIYGDHIANGRFDNKQVKQ